MLDRLRKHPALEEFNSNKRLQWLLLFIICILCLSGLKALVDMNFESAGEVRSELRLLLKLQKAAGMELDTPIVKNTTSEAERLIASIPSAPSVSVAEANALSRLEVMMDKTRRGRSSLVGTEAILETPVEVWQVRVEYQGQLNEHHFSSLLEQLDGSDTTTRVISFRFKPGNSGSFAIVLDFLFKKQAV